MFRSENITKVQKTFNVFHRHPTFRPINTHQVIVYRYKYSNSIKPNGERERLIGSLQLYVDNDGFGTLSYAATIKHSNRMLKNTCASKP